MRLLLTRPEPEAGRSAETLRARGHDVLISPMLNIEAVGDAHIGEGPFDGVLITSGNAARALGDHAGRDRLLSLPCYAVGNQTAQAARDLGFSDVHSAQGDGGDLARLIADALGGRPATLLYLAGSDRARDMDAALRPAHVRLQTIVIYRARAADAFTPEAVSALRDGRLDAVLHYSRRSSAIFAGCLRHHGLTGAALRVRHVCLSARAAEPLVELGATDIAIAPHPEEEAMLRLVPA